MTNAIAKSAAALLLAGGAVLVAAPAWAGADDGGVKDFWNTQAGPAPAQQTVAQAQPTGQYTASYAYQPTQNYAYRPSQAAPDTAAKPEEKDIYFYHAMGTMSRP